MMIMITYHIWNLLLIRPYQIIKKILKAFLYKKFVILDLARKLVDYVYMNYAVYPFYLSKFFLVNY